MPVALLVLLVITVLAGVAAVVATHTNTETRRDTGSKAALEAADAGMRTAVYRMNMLGSQTNYCPVSGSNPPQPDATTNLCPQDGPETLSSGSTFSYWVSGPLTPQSQCAGNWLLSSQSVLGQRCVTAVGTVNGQIARTQSRVVSYAAVTPFAAAGLVGTDGLNISPGQGHNGAIGAEIGSAKNIALGNNVTVNGNNGVASELGIGGSMTTGNGDVITGTQLTGVDKSNFNLPPADPGNSAANIGSVGGVYYNSDDRIANCAVTPTSTQDQCSPTGIWSNIVHSPLLLTDHPRWVTIGNNATVTFSGTNTTNASLGGVYNFCSFTTGNNAVINVALNTKITIFIDSPSDPNSNCPVGSGTFTLGNNTIINNPNTYVDAQGVVRPDPTSLKIFIYGNSTLPSSSIVTFNNNNTGVTPLTLYAPNSVVNLQNNGVLTGGVYGYQVNVTNNFTFNYDGIESHLTTSTQGVYYRSAWRQCPGLSFLVSAPTAGC
jgi:Tfp pilus assembly protein PilX